jgi:hypothetical protein
MTGIFKLADPFTGSYRQMQWPGQCQLGQLDASTKSLLSCVLLCQQEKSPPMTKKRELVLGRNSAHHIQVAFDEPGDLVLIATFR